MKRSGKTQLKSRKPFSIKDLSKSLLKSHSSETTKASFAIEGIRFSKSQFASLKSRRHLKK